MIVLIISLSPSLSPSLSLYLSISLSLSLSLSLSSHNGVYSQSPPPSSNMYREREPQVMASHCSTPSMAIARKTLSSTVLLQS
ncbi:MAG: hypothetical protein MJE68_04070 [Proteobacteria bacterium]|nr:hypothetical protein [Pseudomonadota bacterium]